MLLRVFSVAALAISAAWGQGTGGGNTTTTCPQGAFLYQGRCSTSCPAGMVVYPSPPTTNSTCITAPSPVPSPSSAPSKSPAPSSYPSRSPAPSPSASFSPAPPAGPCDTQLPGGLPDSNGVCQCAPTDWIVRIQGVVAPPFQRCAPVSASMSPPYPPVACASFVNGTVFSPEVGDCVCRVPGPFVVTNQADRILPYACSSVPDMTGDGLLSCNTTAYFSVLQGICWSLPPPPAPSMNATMPSPSMDPKPSPTTQACPADWFLYKDMCMPFCPAALYQGRCVDSCPTGLYLLQNQCVDNCPPDYFVEQFNGTQACVPKGPGPTSCEEAVPGSHMDLTTGDCVCNKTDWMVRNRTAPFTDRRQMSTFCAPAPAGAPFVNCPSFIDGTWFDPAVQLCQCRRDVPFIVGNPMDPALPYTCVANLTDPAIPVFRCNTTSFFDFRVNGCMPRPPLPSQLPPPPQPSASPAEMPSRLPPPPLPSVSPADIPPSMLPPSPSQAPIRIPSASAAPVTPIDPQPSRLPLPSRSALPSYAKTPAPSVAPAQRSAAPSRPPARSIAPTQRPATVQSTLTMPGARIPDNATTATTTNTIQNIQAAIACSLRLPPEQVVIRNVTVTRPDGSLWSPPITTLLSANGTVLCYSLRTGGRAQRLLQDAATGSTGGVAVDYTIVSPPDEVAVLTATELTTTLAASAMMQEVVAVTGATTLTATTDSSLAAAAPSPAAAPADDNKNLLMVAGGVGAGGAVLVVAVAAIAAVIVMRNQRHSATVIKPTQTSSAVTPSSQPAVFVVLNPAEAAAMTQANPMMNGANGRVGFEPMTRAPRV